MDNAIIHFMNSGHRVDVRGLNRFVENRDKKMNSNKVYRATLCLKPLRDPWNSDMWLTWIWQPYSMDNPGKTKKGYTSSKATFIYGYRKRRWKKGFLLLRIHSKDSQEFGVDLFNMNGLRHGQWRSLNKGLDQVRWYILNRICDVWINHSGVSKCHHWW